MVNDWITGPCVWPLKRILLAVAMASFCGHAGAAHRCTDANGKVTYQDANCKGAESNAKVDTSEGFGARPTSNIPPHLAPDLARSNSLLRSPGDYATYRGAWRGPMQLELSLNGVRDSQAHAMAPMVLEIRSDGEVVGQALASGCRFSGLATQNVAPYMASLDVSLKGCTDERFNNRYSGNLMVIDSSKEAKLRLVGLVFKPAVPVAVKLQQISIDAVLKR